MSKNQNDPRFPSRTSLERTETYFGERRGLLSHDSSVNSMEFRFLDLDDRSNLPVRNQRVCCQKEVSYSSVMKALRSSPSPFLITRAMIFGFQSFLCFFVIHEMEELNSCPSCFCCCYFLKMSICNKCRALEVSFHLLTQIHLISGR